VDVFETHRLGAVLERLQPTRCVVYGVVAEICVLYAARGLLRLGKPVTIVTDAIQTLNPERGREALGEIRSLGGELADAASICGPPG
jgi:nicotinamidase/pyrazinamidase